MKKLRDILTVNGAATYATPKKLNRSAKVIPAGMIREIEAGRITLEWLLDAAAVFPLFLYKTCVTLHGMFLLADCPRIGGYKNLRQNKNGSLEVLYSAIDYDKKALIARALRLVNSKYGYHRDSRGSRITRLQPLHDADELERYRPEFEAMAERIRGLDFYGGLAVYLAKAPMLGVYLVFEIHLDAIPEATVWPFIEAMTGHTRHEVENLIAEDDDKRRREALIRETDRAAREAEQRQQKIAEDQLFKSELASKPSYTPDVGKIGAMVYTGAKTRKPLIRLFRAASKGSFGRFNYERTAVRTLAEIENANWRPYEKQLKASDWPICNMRAV